MSNYWDRWYYLDGDNLPVKCACADDMSKVEDSKSRTHLRTETPHGTVSTVFLGLDHAFNDAPPVLWETLVFGGKFDQDGMRYGTQEAATEGHAAYLRKVRGLSFTDEYLAIYRTEFNRVKRA